MNLSEAYKELGLSDGASEKDVNTAFRKLSKKYHPDLNKDNPDAEAKFKKINEAKQTIENPPSQGGGFGWDNWGARERQQQVQARPYQPRERRPMPVVELDLTFLEAAKGATKTIKYDRYGKCDTCEGSGCDLNAPDCDVCHGSGVETRQQRTPMGVITMQTDCSRCGGFGKKVINCNSCNGSGFKKESVEQQIQIPPGVNSGRIQSDGEGNFKASVPIGIRGSEVVRQDVYGPMLISVIVEKDDDMEIDGDNIISTIDISLLDSLKGTSKKVRTIKGDLTLKIRKNTKSGTKMAANGYGPGYRGSHIFNINVDYPDDTSELIEFLENKEALSDLSEAVKDVSVDFDSGIDGYN